MPTSSQALILKNTDGPLHTAFGGRTHWRPAESWMDLFRRNDTSRNSFLFSKHPKRKNPPPRKAETAPNLRLDFATLPEILKISGIRGSFLYNAFECSTQMPYIRRIHGSYDHTINYPAPTNKDTLWSRHSVPNNFSDNAFEWTGHTTGYRALPNKATDWSHNSVPNNVHEKDFELSGHPSNYRTLKTKGADWSRYPIPNNIGDSSRAWTDTGGRNETVYFMPQYRKVVKLNGKETAAQQDPRIDVYHTKTRSKGRELVKLEDREGHMELVKAPVEDAHYFRLQHIEGTEEGAFRLIKSEPNITGSFRLEKTGPQDVGDYRLIPADGYESDDFRLVTLDPKTSSFRLLQADPVDNRQYYVVTTAGEQNGQFRFIQAARREADSHHNHSVEQYADAHSTVNYRLESRDTRETAHKASTPYKSTKNINLYNHAPPTRFSEDRYDYFKDVLPQSDTDREELSPSFLPDITLYDSNNLTGRQHQKHSLNTQHSSDTKQSNLLSSENEMDEFRQKYLDSYRDASPEVYNRLVSLGFKPTKTDKEHRQMKNIQQVNAATETPSRRTTLNTTLKQGLETRKPEARSNYLGVEWRTQNFENWTRTADTGGDDFYNFASNFLPNEVMMMMSNSDRKASVNSRKPSINDRKLSLIDEAKLKANYKAWKKKKITAVRMRKDLPPKDPNAVCVSLRDNAMPHGRLKELVEKNTGHSLIGLQFDPVSVHSIDNDAKSQWILRFEDPAVCERLVDYGLPIEGDLVPVRKYDDVMKEEHEAYQYYMILNAWRKRQQEKINENERKPRIKQKKRLTSSHTQTAGAT